MKKKIKFGLIVVILILPVFYINNYITINSKYNTIVPQNCTIFTVSNDTEVFFCSNEDFFPNHMRMYFIPASNGKYGKVLFGFTIYNTFSPLSGMNDQGLCADENSVSKTPVKRDENKTDYLQNNLFTRLLEECADVNEVIEWIKNSMYNFIQMESYPSQTHIADRYGNAIVLGIDPNGNINYTLKSGDYLVSTNFNLLHGIKSTYRYDVANEMLNSMVNLSVSSCASVLNATAQRNSWGTTYSTIMKPKTGTIYIYQYADFDHYAELNLYEELSKGFHSYDIYSYVINNSNAPIDMNLIFTYSITLMIVLGLVILWIYSIRKKINKVKSIKKEEKYEK